jgi:hypothetical protein
MRNGECGITKNGQKYCMKNGRVRFVKSGTTGRKKRVGNAPGSPYHHKLSNISDLVGVSMGALNRLAAGVSKCITVVTPQGVKSICNKMTGSKRKTAMSGAKRKTRKRRTVKR